ncbi:hypothetical protein F5882DRAFT_414116 [Hyaloscypha sp. PMI_1271]|nr:hypothetical protein F5882DRAFT_414116 [Hyaloscypha sp. PMI_1271]
MFGGPAPPPSAAELKAQESEAALTVQKVVVGAILLYLCMYMAYYVVISAVSTG